MTIGKNMMIISVEWQGTKSFKLMPVTIDCPFVEAIFDPQGKFLVVISKEKKETFHMVTRLSENGDAMPKSNNRDEHKKQRVAIDTYQEYYIQDKEDVKSFIELFTMEGQDKSKYYEQYLPVDGTEQV